MHSNNPFIQGQLNLRFLVKAKSAKDYNIFLFNQLNINNKYILSILVFFTPLIYVVNIFITLIIVLFNFFSSLYIYRWRINSDEYKNISELYLFFINHFPDRCKASKFYEESKYWIISPAIDLSKYNLSGKTIINYRKYLTKEDSFRIFYESCKFICEYILKIRTICLIHKIWEFYEVKYSLQRLGKDCILYFSNQSDKYALLFDQVKSKGKVLFQHGIVTNWGDLPYKLNNITEFHAMSNQTWKDAYEHLLSNSPNLVVMQPTIKLYDIPQTYFNVLVVSEIDYIDIERVILKELTKELSITIYLKKHPALVNDASYRELQKQYGFNYITDSKFPKVDFVISYYSTLAYEYMTYDIPVYMYMSKDDFNIADMNSAIHNCIIKKCRTNKY